jgi:hypothetical protein
MNYHIGRLVLSSLCVGAFGARCFWWGFVLQPEAPGSISRTFVLVSEDAGRFMRATTHRRTVIYCDIFNTVKRWWLAAAQGN